MKRIGGQPKKDYGPLLAAGVSALLIVQVIAMLIQVLPKGGPRVGDIVAFTAPAAPAALSPSPAAPPPVDEVLQVKRTGGTGCVLDLAELLRSGGSLVVEQRETGPRALLRAHWAGRRTSAGVGDCGPAADLLLTGSDMTALAIVAGGYGAGTRGLGRRLP